RACASCLRSLRCTGQDFPDNRLVAEGAAISAVDLVILVPFAGDQDCIAAHAALERRSYRARAIVVDTRWPPLRHPLENVGNYPRRVFSAGVVVGDDDFVRKLGRDPTHEWPLARVTVTATPENDAQL